MADDGNIIAAIGAALAGGGGFWRLFWKAAAHEGKISNLEAAEKRHAEALAKTTDKLTSTHEIVIRMDERGERGGREITKILEKLNGR